MLLQHSPQTELMGHHFANDYSRTIDPPPVWINSRKCAIIRERAPALVKQSRENRIISVHDAYDVMARHGDATIDGFCLAHIGMRHQMQQPLEGAQLLPRPICRSV